MYILVFSLTYLLFHCGCFRTDVSIMSTNVIHNIINTFDYISRLFIPVIYNFTQQMKYFILLVCLWVLSVITQALQVDIPCTLLLHQGKWSLFYGEHMLGALFFFLCPAYHEPTRWIVNILPIWVHWKIYRNDSLTPWVPAALVMKGWVDVRYPCMGCSSLTDPHIRQFIHQKTLFTPVNLSPLDVTQDIKMPMNHFCA
jgi:hypothetical protein